MDTNAYYRIKWITATPIERHIAVQTWDTLNSLASINISNSFQVLQWGVQSGLISIQEAILINGWWIVEHLYGF